MVVNSKAQMPVTAALTGSDYDGKEMIACLQNCGACVIIVDGESLCRECGSEKVLNVILLGAAIRSGAVEITAEEAEKALLGRLPEKVHELNRKALKLGMRGTL